ncbi:MAG TPA: ABC transporter ATP-binding protein [Candidatus Methanoculleus thermohydrogenotrophicum]|jgi:ABC-type sulfate/molybdate transport systems ATPase subunit|nr:ABC transporter ATP-binding protein [Candidatus Methanoculleus thermohydrogenotrophicum]NLM82684.1 ABC transporter ATP-binding protein [Candidatus Methanoculleus thermohydrogenotrophicum]HOB17704.1 ABC transporter ATP-binding protein [Candidatus Methanoculleus thermohydrogenotrophicum]HPZ37939.1 ABC transporter ATP-binding protein [Candidatus Methanoculleus thermohydrogenotrophicum]HQC91122.1 ABC transporter ATP-binding protein [Candidatus Methanoculleus thermohydrogenotrophicum]
MLSFHVVRQLRDFVLDVALSVEEGETLVLIGENGAGKSTVLNLISGILAPDRGEITLGDRILFSDRREIDVPTENRNIGHLFQSYALFPHMTVAENVAFGLQCRKVPKSEIAKSVAEQLAAMNLSDLADVNVGRLSGGQRQRVALARALVLEPELLLLDEPLAAVDMRAKGAMRKELRDQIWNAGIPCIVVTHTLRDVLELADRLCLLEEGKVMAYGAPEEVLGMQENGFIASFTEG